MRFYADECFDGRIVAALLAAGAEVISAATLAQGAADVDVLAAAHDANRVVLTEDKDFGALVFRDGRVSIGIVLVRVDRIADADGATIAARILALADHGRGAFTTLDMEGHRVRALPADEPHTTTMSARSQPMMRLFVSTASPFARKCRIVVREKGLVPRVDEVFVDPLKSDATLAAVNPLGQIPALVDEAGLAWTDSPLICARLDEIGAGAKLIPEGEARWAVLRREVLADGILELGVKMRLEALRPEAERSPSWLARWREGVLRALDRAEAEAPEGEGFDLGVIALACALSWLDFRHSDLGWRPTRPRLARLQERLELRASFGDTAPA